MTVLIKIKLFASLKRYAPADADRYPIEEGIPVAQLIESLGIPPDDVKLIFVNSVRTSRDHPLTGGERVGLFPPIGGG